MGDLFLIFIVYFVYVFLARAFFHWTAEAEAMQVAFAPLFNQK